MATEVRFEFEGMPPVEGMDRIYADYRKTFGRHPDAFMAQVVEHTKEDLFIWWGSHRERIRAALVAADPGEEARGRLIDEQLARERADAPSVTVTVPVNRPATPEEAEHAARIGACLPNGAMFDAFGRERVRYVRVIHDGTTCVVSPGDVADLVDPGRPDDYRIEDVYLSKEEFDALPEFDGF